jgi:hypothetical protein
VALHAFVGHVGRATELLAALQAHFDEHMGVGPDEVHWGHVGSAGKACEDLEELCRFLGVGA